ncbi:MAG: DKNYY domain-containing protein [Flammeovirgaceae bacterium]|nr:DKNYY domain-containing protein [Flammeovirgaceae bacterium]
MKTLYIFLIVILILFGSAWIVKYYVIRLGEAVDKEVSKSYYFHAIKKKIVYAPMSNWFELGYTELDADPTSFKVLAEEFGKDKNSIFWKGVKQPVDFSSFYVDENIPKDNQHVYTKNSTTDLLTIIKGADPATYKRFDTGVDTWDRYWFRDYKHYFYEDTKLEVDYQSFKRINNTLAVDTNFVYAIINTQTENGLTNRGVIKKVGRMAGVIKVINSSYAFIGNTVILSNWKNEFNSIAFDKIESLAVLDDRNITINKILIHDGKIFPDVDVESLVLLDRDYFKDKTSAYCDGQLIPNAQASSFELVSDDYSRDSENVFFKTTQLSGVVAKDFRYDYATNIGTDGTSTFKDGKLVTR